MKKQIIKPEQGKRLKMCLKYANKTQKWLSEKSYLTEPYISDIIRGKAPLTPENALTFSKLLKVRLKYLLLESDFMTEEDRVSAICKGYTNRDIACYDLIESLGYKIIGMKENPDGSQESMHRDYKKLIINTDDTPEQILERANNTYPVRIFILESPTGKQVYIEQDELSTIIKNIYDYAKFLCDKPFHRFDNHFLK